MPCDWLTALEFYDDISLYELRIIYWIAIASHQFLLLYPRGKKFMKKLPDPDILRNILYCRYYAERLANILSLFENCGELSTHQLNSIYMLKYKVQQLSEEDTCKNYLSSQFHQEINEIIIKVNDIPNLAPPVCIICNINILFNIYFL